MPTLTATQPPVNLPTTRAEAAARIAVKYPHLSHVAARALAIADTDKVRPLSLTRVYVVSEQGKQEYQLTAGTNGWQCTCPAWYYNPVYINGRRYCKHIMAMAIYYTQENTQ